MCLVFGFPSRVKETKEQNPKGKGQCPRCHNISVTYGKERYWFEFFFIRLIPLCGSNIYFCPICSWQGKRK
ncbi:hypothetical protein E3Q00_01480 [Wallemia mellicola]|nr:hypothetical protein E3Q00_01480 [Wallemia mellicola]